MKKAKKALLISIFSLVFAVAIATTSTLAWFAMSDDPTVEEFELTVTTNENLYISASEESGYGFDLAASDLTNYASDSYRLTQDTTIVTGKTYYTTTDQTSFTAVTTPAAESIGTYYEKMGAINTIALDACSPDSAESTMALKKMDGSSAAVGSYYEFNLYFLSAENSAIKLDYDKISIINRVQSTRTVAAPVAISAEDMTKAYGTTTAAAEQYAAIDAKAANAARIAFISGTTAVVYNPNSDKGWSTITTTGQTNMAELVYEYQSGEQITIGDEVSTVSKSTGHATTIVTMAEENSPSTNLRSEATRLGIAGDATLYTGSVKVIVWLEGKDADCFNSIYQDVLSVAIGFTTAA